MIGYKKNMQRENRLRTNSVRLPHCQPLITLHVAIQKESIHQLSAFRTHEDRQPTSKLVAACPCPDGLMQDGTQVRNVAYVISHRGARSRGYKRRETARARARGHHPALSVLQRLSMTCPRPPCLRKALDIPFYRYKEMPSYTMGCSCVLSWLAGKRLEPCRWANVAVGEAP
jgi:hypothetical protein